MFSNYAEASVSMRSSALLYGAIVAVFLGGCSSAPSAPEAGPVTQAPAATTTNAAFTAGSVPAVSEPEPPEAREQLNRAVALLDSGATQSAEQELRALINKYPEFSGPLVNLAILQTKTGQLKDAEQTLQQAIQRNPNNASAYNQLGIVYRQQGRFREADESYSQALKIKPDYAIAHLNLGILCDLYLQQPQRALEAYQRYLELSSEPDPKVSDWVTELKSRLGQQQSNAATP